ncbi:MAG: hypothetical protein JWP35_1249 [Caulobacter sp.]|nr:hypothetical protein [Caulobacter sp.]
MDETPKRTRKPTVAKKGLVAPKIVRLLREEILAKEDGAYLGREEDLLARYGISRPTLQQTSRILEHEQLMTVRRGPNGGYYARRPNIGSVARSAANFLRTRDTTLRHLIDAAHAASIAMVRLAATSRDEAGREALRRYLDAAVVKPPSAMGLAEFLTREAELAGLIADLAGNPALALYITVLYQVGLEDTRERVFSGRDDRKKAWADVRARLAQTILEGEPEFAAVLSERSHAMMLSWLEGAGDQPALADASGPSAWAQG